MVPKLLTYTGRDCLSDMPSNPPPVFVFNVMFMGHMYQRSMLAHLEVPPTLGGVFRVALLIRGPWRSSHIGRVVVVAWVVSPVPSSSSYSRLQIRQISWNLMNKSSTGVSMKINFNFRTALIVNFTSISPFQLIKTIVRYPQKLKT